jgi:hypothetical protein
VEEEREKRESGGGEREERLRGIRTSEHVRNEKGGDSYV